MKTVTYKEENIVSFCVGVWKTINLCVWAGVGGRGQEWARSV